MSGGHYDCFYGWEDWDEIERRANLIEQVARDYNRRNMPEAEEILRGAAALLRAFLVVWNHSKAPALCHHMDWYMACDTSEDDMRERVAEELRK